MDESKNKNSLGNFKDLFRNTSRIFSILLHHMPWLFSGMVILTIVVGTVPIFSAQALGTLIDKIIEGVKVQDVSVAYPALVLFAVLTVLPTTIRNVMSF